MVLIVIHLSMLRKEQKYVACYIKARGSIITRIDVLTLARLTRDRSLVEINFSPRFGDMDRFDHEKNEITKCPPRPTKEYRLNKLEVRTQRKGTLTPLGFILADPESSFVINLPAKKRINFMRKSTSLII
jgi:hypothetical protein